MPASDSAAGTPRDFDGLNLQKYSIFNSLTARVTLSGIGLMLLAVMALTLYASQRQRTDMEQQLGAQQQSTASFIAATMEREFQIRLSALQQIASPITPQQLQKPAELVPLMAGRPVFQGLFNAGTMVTDRSGRVVAAVPTTGGGAALSQQDAQQIAGFLSTAANSLVFLAEGGETGIRMAVPIRHQGVAIGALVGTNDLDAPNFLDIISKSRYGESGAYALYAVPQQRMVLASASLIQSSPDAARDRTVEGGLQEMFRDTQGTYVASGPDGTEHLISSQRIALANWRMAVMQPTEEAFAVVADQRRSLWIAALAGAVILGVAAWWVVQRQFLPVRKTVRALQDIARPDQLNHTLPLTGQQEIDHLIAGFNQLLSILAQRNADLQSSYALNQHTLDSLQAQIAVISASGGVMAVNKTWTQSLQDAPARVDDAQAVCAGVTVTAGHAKGASSYADGFGRLFGAEAQMNAPVAAEITQAVHDVLNGQRIAYRREYAVPGARDTQWLDLSVTPLDGPRRAAVVSRTDISERRRSEALLRKLSRIAEQAPLAILITDLRGNIEYANPHFSDMSGYSAQQVMGQNPRMLKSGKTPPETYRALWETLHARKVWRGEFSNLRKNGEPLVERAVIAPVIDADGVVTHYVALKEDITEIQKQEKRRAALSLRIEELSRRLVRVQEESRMRFSQELHDRTSPNLAALRINLDIIARTLESLRLEPALFDRIEDTRALIDDTTASIREICAGLHPAAIERGGLLGVVRAYCEQFARRTGVRVELHCPHDERRLSADLELALFRIIQEALTNSAKHAKASFIDLRMQFDQSPVIVTIADDGCGFDPATLAASGNLPGLGLVNMRDTVDFAGGRLRIDSAPGEGTRIYIEI